MSKSRFLLTLSIILLIFVVFAGTSCSKLKNIKAPVTGTVYMDGRPASGTVAIKDEGGTVIAQERTNINGHFRITDLNPGTYKIVYFNYQGVPWKTEQVIQIRLGRPEVVELQLNSADRMSFN